MTREGWLHCLKHRSSQNALYGRGHSTIPPFHSIIPFHRSIPQFHSTVPFHRRIETPHLDAANSINHGCQVPHPYNFVHKSSMPAARLGSNSLLIIAYLDTTVLPDLYRRQLSINGRLMSRGLKCR